MFKGYWLDDYTFICLAKDKDGKVYWTKLTTYVPKDKYGNITCDPFTGRYFDIEIIDSDHFEWKGQIFKLQIGDK